MADQWDYLKHQAQREKAEKAAAVLRSAGYKVKYFSEFYIVRVIVGTEFWYVDRIPEVEDYGKTVIDKQWRECCDECCSIDLKYENEKYVTLYLLRREVNIHGKNYVKTQEDSYYIGHLRDNVYTCYKNAWISGDLIKYLGGLFRDYETPMPDNIDDLILNAKFKPVKKQIVDIKNNGLKFVRHLRVDKTQSSIFTAFSTVNRMEFIADGRYVKKHRDSLFKYTNEEGEAFAILDDILTYQTTLVSSSRIVEINVAENHIIECVDGLYNGCVVSGDCITKYINDHGEYPKIYEYNGVYFTFIKGIEILDARAPHSGMHTKAAAVTNY